jgi:hypothetical protein
MAALRRCVATTCLVLSVLAGVVAMHGLTTGHHGAHEMPSMTMSTAMPAASSAAMMAPDVGRPAGVPGDDHERVTSCLAILVVGVALLALASLAAGSGSRPAADRRSLSRPARAARPRRTSLLLSQLQVLRT